MNVDGFTSEHREAVFLPDVDALFNQLLPLGINVLEKPNATVYNMRRFTIADPDGYNLSFQGPAAPQ